MIKTYFIIQYKLQKLKPMKYLFSLLFILASILTTAQNYTFLLVNGKKIQVDSYTLTVQEGDSVFNYITLNGKKRHKFAEKIFSISHSNGQENVIYRPNAEIDNTFTIEQMKSYVNGRFEGRQMKTSPLVGISAFAIGFGSAFLPIPALSISGNSFSLPLGMLVPVANMVIMGNVDTPEKVLAKKNKTNNSEEYYLIGVEESLKKKRIKHSLIGGVLGLVAGVITVIAVH